MNNKKRNSKVFLCLLMIICSVIVFSACEIVNRPSISSISVVYTPGEEDVYPDTSLDELKDFVVVKVHYSDDTTETITDYVLSGTLEEGESVITVSYKGFEKTFTVNVSEKPDDPHVHNLIRHEAKPATCTEDGNIEYWSCTVCHKNYSDENATVEVSEIVTTTDEHRFSDKWSTDVYYHWHATICGHNVKSDYAEHTFADGKCMVCQMDEVSPTQGLEYTLNDDMESYTVTGIGTATDLDLIIPSLYNGYPVTGIGSWAFRRCKSLTSVAIPESVTSIGDYAFGYCSSLTSVTISGGVTSIGDYAFWYCSSLTSVTIPDSVTSIGQQAFVACRSLTSVTIPDSVTSIGDDAFSSCRSLTSVTIGRGVTSIDEDAFAYCPRLVEVYNLSSLPITKGSEDYGRVGYNALNVYTSKDEASKLVKTDDGYIFYKDGNTVYLIGYTGSEKELTLPDKYNGNNYEINKSAFSSCTSLTRITIPDSVTSIGDYAFEYCNSLTGVTIPDSVTSIGFGAFEGCSSLESITLPFVGATKDGSKGNTYFGYIFGSKSYSFNRYDTPPSLKTVVITGGSRIASNAFYDCEWLTSVTIPESVTSIGEYAFRHCTYLTSVTIPKNVTSIGRSAFDFCESLTSVTIPDSVTSIGSWAFNGCDSLTCVTISSGVTSIGENTFSGCDSLTSVTIPESVTYVGKCAFYGSLSLTSVTIGSGVISIDEDAFSGCFKLVEVYNLSSLPITKGSEDYGKVGYYALNVYTSKYEASKLAKTEDGYIFYEDGDTVYLVGYTGSETELTLPDKYNNKNYGIYKYAFYGRDSLTSVTIPESVTSIGEYAFSGCRSLTSVAIPESVTSIGSGAFEYCRSLTSVAIPESVTLIGQQAFSGCRSLTSVTIPESVTSIGEDAFSDCTSLKSVTIPESVTSIGESVFSGCSSLTSVTIPGSVTSISSWAFYRCESLTSVAIPDSVTSIGSGAFSGCRSLTSITIPDSVTSIDQQTFSGCRSLTSVTIPGSITSIGIYAFSGCFKLVEVYNLSSLSITKGSEDYGRVGYYALNVYTSTDGASKLAKTEDGYIFYEDGDTVYLIGYTGSETELTLPDKFNDKNYEIYKYAFNYCRSLTSVTIPDSVTSIGEDAFRDCTSLTSVTIGNGVTSIDDYAFSGCDSITSVTIGSGVTSIGYSAFDSCFKLVEVYNLSSLTIKKGSKEYGRVGYYALNVYTSKDEASKLAKTEDGYIFYEDGDTVYLIGYTGSETELTLPDKYNNKNYGIYKYALYGRDSLTSVTIPEGVTSIGNYAFEYCTSLTSVTISDSVTSIGSGAFEYCTSLTSVTIPGGVTSIGEFAFRGCDSLTSVTILGGGTSIGEYAFSNCFLLTSVTIGNGVKSIGYSAFSNCFLLTSVTIGSGVTSIGDDAFSSCTSLAIVYYNGTAEEWSDIAIVTSNLYLFNATRYYYSETEPATDGNFWHYVDGEVVVWEKAN